jgi:hypothetical protein
LTEHFGAAHAGHGLVADQHFDTFALKQTQGIAAVLRQQDAAAMPTEQLIQRAQNIWLVVHAEDRRLLRPLISRCHAPTSLFK